MKPKLSIVFMAVILFLNVSSYGSAEEKKTKSWITKKEASLPPMKRPKRENKNPRVIYLKMFGIDITDRILPYVKETRIDANGIKFPEGKHEFEIRIKDKEKMESAQIFKIKVK